MWRNIGNVVGNALDKVKKLQAEIENQLDAAVGKETDVVANETETSSPQSSTTNLITHESSLHDSPTPTVDSTQISSVLTETIVVNDITSLSSPESVKKTRKGKKVRSKKVVNNDDSSNGIAIKDTITQEKISMDTSYPPVISVDVMTTHTDTILLTSTTTISTTTDDNIATDTHTHAYDNSDTIPSDPNLLHLHSINKDTLSSATTFENNQLMNQSGSPTTTSTKSSLIENKQEIANIETTSVTMTSIDIISSEIYDNTFMNEDINIANNNESSITDLNRVNISQQCEDNTVNNHRITPRNDDIIISAEDRVDIQYKKTSSHIPISGDVHVPSNNDERTDDIQPLTVSQDSTQIIEELKVDDTYQNEEIYTPSISHNHDAAIVLHDRDVSQSSIISSMTHQYAESKINIEETDSMSSMAIYAQDSDIIQVEPDMSIESQSHVDIIGMKSSPIHKVEEQDEIMITVHSDDVINMNPDNVTPLQSTVIQNDPEIYTTTSITTSTDKDVITVALPDTSTSNTDSIVYQLSNNHKEEFLSLQYKYEEQSVLLQDYMHQLSVSHEENKKLSEKLHERERSLETAMIQMYEVNAQQIQYQDQIIRLQHELDEKTSQIINLNKIYSAGDGDMKNKIKKLQDLLVEKDEKIGAFEYEGQKLSKKIGEYEKNIKNYKKEIKEQSTEITKLKESKEQLNKVITELQECVKKNELEISNLIKNTSTMNIINQTSGDKILKLESEISSKNEELVIQKRALDNAWNEVNELKRQLVDIKAEKEDLIRQIQDKYDKVYETETSKRDIEQREAILKATSKQLQESLQRQMNETHQREERLQQEIHEMRIRWQDAIVSKEILTTELANTTTPLLRQISSLQDTLKNKTDSWQQLEMTLSDRLYKADKEIEKHESIKTSLMQQSDEWKHKYEQISSQYTDIIQKYEFSEKECCRLRGLNDEYEKQIQDLQSQIFHHTGQYQLLQTSYNELEIRKTMEIQELQREYEDKMTTLEVKLQQTHKYHYSPLTSTPTPMSPSPSPSPAVSKSTYQNISTVQYGDRNNGDNNDNSNSEGLIRQGNNSDNNSENIMYNNHRPDQDHDIIGDNMIISQGFSKQKFRKSDELQSLYLKIKQVEKSRDALLEEVSYLSALNQQYEEKINTVDKKYQEIHKLMKQNDALLLLVGEKEEELQAALSDQHEIRAMYQTYIQELTYQITSLHTQNNATAGNTEQAIPNGYITTDTTTTDIIDRADVTPSHSNHLTPISSQHELKYSYSHSHSNSNISIQQRNNSSNSGDEISNRSIHIKTPVLSSTNLSTMNSTPKNEVSISNLMNNNTNKSIFNTPLKST